MATGAWYAPDAKGLELAGNPNVLSLDVGTSRLTQGCAALSVLVEVERYAGKAATPAVHPPVAAAPARPAPRRAVRKRTKRTPRRRAALQRR
jgi:biotin/methionine sulfoxide reductase